MAKKLKAGFGKGFLEGEKEAVRAATSAMEKMTPVAEHFGSVFGWVHEKWEGFRRSLVDVVSYDSEQDDARDLAGVVAEALLAGVFDVDGEGNAGLALGVEVGAA